MDQRIRVVIVEDHTIIREGLRSLLNQARDFNIVGGSGRRAGSAPAR